jgi:hypothetical protein
MNAPACARRTYSNPATVAALIRVNGLDAVLRAGLAPRRVIRSVIVSKAGSDFAQHRRLKAAARRGGDVWRALRFARRHGVAAIRAADAAAFPLRLVSGMIDCWHRGCDAGRIGRSHGYDVALRLARLDRDQLTYEALKIGVDLRAIDLEQAPHGSRSAHAISQRVMRRACRLFGVTKEELKGTSRHQIHVVPRCFYFYWTMRLGKAAGNGVSFPMMGRSMGGRDHTTALHGYRTWPAKRDAARLLVKARRAAQ